MLLDSNAASGLWVMYKWHASTFPPAYGLKFRTYTPPTHLWEGIGGQDISLCYLRLLRLWSSWLFWLLTLLPSSTLGLENILVLRFSSVSVWEGLRLPVFESSSGDREDHDGFMIPKSLLSGPFSNRSEVVQI